MNIKHEKWNHQDKYPNAKNWHHKNIKAPDIYQNFTNGTPYVFPTLVVICLILPGDICKKKFIGHKLSELKKESFVKNHYPAGKVKPVTVYFTDNINLCYSMFFWGILHRLFSISSLMISGILIKHISKITFSVIKFLLLGVVDEFLCNLHLNW